MASPEMRLSDSSLPPMPLAIDNEIIEYYISQQRLVNLLSSFPRPEQIPPSVVRRLPLLDLCSDPSLHSYLALWGHSGILDKRAIINSLVSILDVKTAKIFVRKFDLQLKDFPELLQASYEKSFAHWVFSEKMSYHEVAKLCADDLEAVRAFVRWTHSRQTLAARCAIVLGVEDAREQWKLFEEFSIPPISNEEALSIWFDDVLFFPVDESKLPDREPWRSLLYGHDNISLAAINLRLQNIELVSTMEHFDQIYSMLETATLLGLDCEWRPSLVGDRIFPVALFQLAFRDPQSGELKCFLVDVHSFRQQGLHEHVLRRIDTLLQSESSLKLGCSFLAQDVGMLHRSVEDKQLFTHIANYIETANLVRAYWDPSFQGGMGKAIAQVLGKEVDKGQQCRNWEIRPLPLAQAIYAALDAATLILVAEESQRRDPRASLMTTTLKLQKPKVKNPNAIEARNKKYDEKIVQELPGTIPLEPGKLNLWRQTKRQLEEITPYPLARMTLAVFRCPPHLVRTLRSFGFPLLTGLERVWSARKTGGEQMTTQGRWIEVAVRCLEEDVVLLLSSKTEYEQLGAALSHAAVLLPPLPYFMLNSTDSAMKVRELLWLWSLAPLTFPVHCLECGSQLKTAANPLFKECQSMQCGSLIWREQLRWYESRNRFEYRRFYGHIDALATVHEPPPT